MTRTETKIDIIQDLNIEELNMAQLLTDEYCMKILSGITRKSMSISEMAFTYYIPLGSCYRKVAELEAAGLIKVEGRLLSKDGKRYTVYRSCLENFEVRYKGDKIRMLVELKGKEPKVITIDLNKENMIIES